MRVVLLDPDMLAEDGSGKAVQPETGYVWLEWIGQPSPTISPTVRFLMLRDRLPAIYKKAIRTIAAGAIRRVDGKTSRTIERGNGYGQIPGLTQTWTFGPKKNAGRGQRGSYIQKVPNRDADLIKSSPSGKEFRVLGYAGDTDIEPVTAMTNAIIGDVFQTKVAKKLGEAEGFKTYRALSRKMGWDATRVRRR